MFSHPSASELLTAIRSFLEDKALPELKGRTAFHARVALNALAIVQREIDGGADAEAAELARLERLVGDDHQVLDAASRVQQRDRLAALNRELCGRIRRGELALDDARLREHLWATVLDSVAVDQPQYSAFRKHVDPPKAER